MTTLLTKIIDILRQEQERIPDTVSQRTRNRYLDESDEIIKLIESWRLYLYDMKTK